MTTSERRLLLIGALNRRGLKGGEARILLHRYSQERIARQIDYYDFEICSAAGLSLPLWAAAPWLSHRIRRDRPAPATYRPTDAGLLADLWQLPNEAGRRRPATRPPTKR